jgi:hypothetical protein
MNWRNIIRLLGVATCLTGAFLMAFGEPIIAADHAGIATVVGITGIGLIGTGNTLSSVRKKKEEP